jgi:hypothetical protein
MSKVDAQRAMKEARYVALMAQASTTRRGTPTRPEPAATTPARTPAPTSADAAPKRPATRRTPSPRAETTPQAETTPAQTTSTADPADALCGHRSIGNKSCQRPAGHTEKNHRYK